MDLITLNFELIFFALRLISKKPLLYLYFLNLSNTFYSLLHSIDLHCIRINLIKSQLSVHPIENSLDSIDSLHTLYVSIDLT